MRHPLALWRLRRWPGSRIARELTGSELALLAGLRQSTVSRVETCIDPMRAELLAVVRQVDGDEIARQVEQAAEQFMAARRQALLAEASGRSLAAV